MTDQEAATTAISEQVFLAAKAIVDVRAGKAHSSTGVVASALREAIDASLEVARPLIEAEARADERQRILTRLGRLGDALHSAIEAAQADLLDRDTE
jgi:hypothetical protein